MRSTSPSFPSDPTHPLQVAARTYALALSLSLGPSLIPFVPSLLLNRPAPPRKLSHILRRELSPTGFAFALLVAAGGGAALQYVWETLAERGVELPWDSPGTFTPAPSRARTPEPSDGESKAPNGAYEIAYEKIKTWMDGLKPVHRAFISNGISSSFAFYLLQAGRRRPWNAAAPRDSPTLDLTLLLLVRAIDMTVQAIVLRRTAKPDAAERERLRHRRTLTTRIDAFVFWASSARIMWCFFYQPERLPKSYVKWITNLAMVDPRLLRALRAIREGDFSYVRGTSVPPDLLTSYAAELGFPRTWGDPAVLPAYSGSAATKVWERIGVEGRAGVGGLPCELVHGGLGRKVGLGDGCYTNAGVRAGFGFLEAIALYLPVHFIPILLTRPRAFLRPHTLVRPLLGAVRSASFLSSFLLLIWSTLCTGRTFLPALLPSIPHDFWDGPHGAVLAACIACGASIWAEDGRRRGEVALYVLPRAVRACLPRGWGKEGGRGERVTFVLALAALLTGARHRPDALRGLARWTGAFIMRGPDAGFWRKGREGTPGPGPRRVDPLGAPGDSEIGSTASGVQTPRDIRQTPTPPP